jgi:transcriptional regulator with XRE-family HTH domain
MLSKTKFQNIIGANIRKIRSDKNLTQDELAHNCGFYRTYINLIETSKRLPSSFSLYRIPFALGVKVDDLYPTTV